MAAKIISGTEVAKQIRQELAKEVAALREKHNVVPGLVTILVGQNPASVSYVTGKQKTAKELGFYSILEKELFLSILLYTFFYIRFDGIHLLPL